MEAIRCGEEVTMQITRVQQEEVYGCGIACLAMVTSKTYQEVCSWFKADRFQTGLTWWDIDGYLAEHGLAVARRWPTTQNENEPLEREVWPLEPWADLHICQVRTPAMAHFVVMLANGTCLDPATPEPKKLSDYESVDNITAVYDVRPKE